MKKTLLATAIPAILFASAASATELYSDDVNTFTVGGHISAGIEGSDEGSTGVNSVSPRINFGATRDLGNGFTTDALVEWSINMEGGEQALSTRLGYLGLTHDEYGRVVVGTQWAPTYDVTGVADMPIAFANDFLYNSDMSAMGTGRADDMVSYRNSFAFANNMALNFGLGAQGGQDDYHSRYQGALSFDFNDFSVGIAYNTGDVNYTAKTETAIAFNVSGKYGIYGQGLYAAVVYGENEFAYRPDARTADNDGTAYAETTDFEAIVAYAFENSVNVSLNYEEIQDDVAKDTLLKQTAVQVEYNFLSNVMGYAGYQIDLGNDLTDKKDNMWMIGGRIYL